MRGLRVIEIGTSVAAPFATQILGDLGAEVVKVERVAGGDDARHWAPPSWEGESVTFLALNRNKRSIALDFKQPSGRAALERLLGTADVLVQNLRPGALAGVGLTPEYLGELNPRLVYCELTGFGPRGPRAGHPAYDPLLQAYSGIVSLTGEDGGAPSRVPVSLLDMGTGMWAALAVLDALRRRDSTGAGSHIEVSLLQTALSWLSIPLMSVLAGAGVPRRMGSGLAGVVPYGALPVSDGHVFVSAGNDTLWRRLCEALAAPHLADRPEFATNGARVQHRAEVDSELARLTGALAGADLLARLTDAGVPCAPVNTLDEVVHDEQVEATGMIQPLPHHHVPDLRVLGLPITFDGAYAPHSGGPPALGSDTHEVLTAAGLTDQEVDDLLAAGVAATAPHREART